MLSKNVFRSIHYPFFLVLFADAKSSNVVSDPSAMSANGELLFSFHSTSSNCVHFELCMFIVSM